VLALLEYEYVGFWAVEKPRWFNFVFLAVGEEGSGDMGESRGDLRGVRAAGERRLREGREVGCVEIGATLMESLGLTALEASILAVLGLMIMLVLMMLYFVL